MSKAVEGEVNLDSDPIDGVADLLISGDESIEVCSGAFAFEFPRRLTLDGEGDDAAKDSWLLMNMPILTSGFGDADSTVSYVGGIT